MTEIKLFKDLCFVRLDSHMASDLAVVNAARVSMSKRSESLNEKDIELINFLAQHEHFSPFRHCVFRLHFKIPEFVARQFYKHIIGSDYTFKDTAFNEVSGRYIEFSDDFWSPDYFRKGAKNVKQGSLEERVENNDELTKLYEDTCKNSFDTYHKLIDAGICKEQARAVLPLSFITEFYWSASLQSCLHFVRLRQDPHAQKEIQELADAMLELITPICPESIKALLNNEVKV